MCELSTVPSPFRAQPWGARHLPLSACKDAFVSVAVLTLGPPQQVGASLLCLPSLACLWACSLHHTWTAGSGPGWGKLVDNQHGITTGRAFV